MIRWDLIGRLALPLLLGVAVAGCGDPEGDPERGEQLYKQGSIGERAAPGCTTCHSLEAGVVKVGPSHAGVGARAADRVEATDYGGEATTAGGYLRESILEPNADLVGGFEPGIMYSKYAEVLSEQQVQDLVTYMLTLQED